MVKGTYQFKNSLPFVPGIEACGIIIEEKCRKSFLIGKKVIVSRKNGCFAEELVAQLDDVIIINKNIKSYIAASFYISYLTAYITLMEIAKIKINQTILITGASGGVGNAMVYISKKIGMKVFAVCSNRNKAKIVDQLGADYCLMENDDIKKKLDIFSGSKKGIDVIIDINGLQKKQNLLKCLKWRGKYLIIGFVDGNITNIRTNYILMKSLRVYGVRAGEYLRKNEKKRTIITKNLKKLLLEKNNIYNGYTIFNFGDLKKGLNLMKSRQSSGKIVVKTKYYEEV